MVAALGGLLTVAFGLVFTAAAGAAVFSVGCGKVTGLTGLNAAIVAADVTPGPSTIDLQDCTYTVAAAAAPFDLSGPDGLPVIIGRLTIDGDGASIVRGSAAAHFRIMHVESRASVVLNGLTVSGGYANAPDLGGGILDDGTLSLESSQVLGNVSVGGGGGIGNDGSLTVTNSTISDNSAPGASDGGGIASGGAVVIQDSTLSDNSAAVGGGAIESFGTLQVSGSQFDGNTALGSAAILDQSTASVSSTGFDGNVASGDNGGALYIDQNASASLSDVDMTDNSAWELGGGIFLDPDTSLTMNSSEIENNVAGTGGGGIYASSGATVNSTNSTITDNQPDNCEPIGSVAGCNGSL